MDLLNPSCPRTLQCYHSRHPWKQGLLLEISQRQPLWSIHHATDVHKPLIYINDWDTAMVSNVVVFISCYRGFDESILSL